MRLFQDAAGTTPANQAGQPVGKVVRAAGTVDASQATALSRPTLARHPKGGRRNLIIASEDFSNGMWGRYGSGIGSAPVVTPDYALAPDGTMTAARVQFNLNGGLTAEDWSDLRQNADPIPVGLRTSISMWLKSADGASKTVGVGNNSGGAGGNITVTPEWQRYSFSGKSVAGAFFWRLWLRGSVAGHSQSADVLLWHPQLEVGELSGYQRVASANDVTEAGLPDVWHLSNDGGDSLPITLPASGYEIAWVTHLGAVSYASVTSDGTTGTDLLRAERMADVLVREGSFTPAEKTALEAYWQQRYAA